jgi:hypothetical protein
MLILYLWRSPHAFVVVSIVEVNALLDTIHVYKFSMENYQIVNHYCLSTLSNIEQPSTLSNIEQLSRLVQTFLIGLPHH